MPYEVLFLCTGNSARSLLAECALRQRGGERFCAHSAGSHPTGVPNPHAVALLRELGFDTAELRSKSWDEFAAPDAPSLDFVFTVCDAAAGETCPVWPGHPMTVHWGVADPAAAVGPDASVRLAFRRAWTELEGRIRRFAALPIEDLDPPALRTRLEEIGRNPDA